MLLTRRALLGTALAAPAARLHAQQPPAGAPAGVPVPFGALYPFSGALALLGDESYRGLELAVEERNAAGGVLGRPIRLVKGDAVDPAQAVAETRRLLGTERVAAVFGTYASSLAFAASPVAELAGTPYFELGAVAEPLLERGFKYLFRSCVTGTAVGTATVGAVADGLAPLWGASARSLRIAILHEDGLYGATVAAAQAVRCTELELQVVDRVAYPAAATDLSGAVQRLREAGADVVLHTGYGNDVVLFFRQMRRAGWSPRMVVGSGGGHSLQDTANAVGADYEGVVNVDFTQYAVNERAAPGVREVRAAYEKRYGAKPRSGHSLANYMGARVFLDAIARAGSLDRDRVRAAVLATDVAAGTTPTGWGVKFDERGQNTRARPHVLQWQDGQHVTVQPTEAALGTLRPTLGS